MRLRAGLSVLWRGPTQVQLGTDPRWAVTLTDLSPSAAAALRSVRTGAELSELDAAFAREQVPGEEAAAIVGHLRSAHLLVEADPSARLGDAAAWALLSADGDTSSLARRRARATVRLVGLSRVGSTVAALLAAAGVGTIELQDPACVTRLDVAPGALGTRDIGAPRTDAVARLLHDVAPQVTSALPGRSPADLVVLVEHGVADPLVHRPLLDDDVPHLSVVVREASVLVGPLVRPGRSACLRCADLHRGDRDEGWPAVAAQLAGVSAETVVETTLGAASAALAAAQVLAHLDGRPTSVHDASLELRLPDIVPRRVEWSPHPDCDCLAPPRAAAQP
jgi:bacteriocin biosynthesis cyclodehydratase domain-containing protein